jgi:hypothetical protein
MRVVVNYVGPESSPAVFRESLADWAFRLHSRPAPHDRATQGRVLFGTSSAMPKWISQTLFMKPKFTVSEKLIAIG